MSRLALIATAIVVGVVLAVGVGFTISGVVGAKPAPANQQLYNYGTHLCNSLDDGHVLEATCVAASDSCLSDWARS